MTPFACVAAMMYEIVRPALLLAINKRSDIVQKQSFNPQNLEIRLQIVEGSLFT